MEAKFKKLSTGEWTVTGDGITREMREVEVTKADGTKKTVKLTGLWSRIDGVQCWKIRDERPMRQFAQGRKSSNLDRYDNKYVRGVCQECVFNGDAGDGRGCAKHRGNPHT